MDSVSIPLLPSGLWILATSLVIVIMIVMSGYHLYFRQRVRAALSDAKDVADLAARKETLEAQKNELSRWISDQREEILDLKGEREEQQKLRLEIEGLREDVAEKENELSNLKDNLADFGRRNYVQEQVFKHLLEHIDQLEEKKAEIQRQLEPGIERNREIGERIDEAREELRNVMSNVENLTTRFDEEKKKLAQNETRRNDLSLETSRLEARENELNKDIKKSQSTLEKVNEDININQTKLNRIQDEIEESRYDLNTLRIQIENLKTTRDEAQVELENLHDKKNALDSKIFLLSDTKDQLEKDKENAGKLLQTVLKNIQKHEADEAAARERLNSVIQSRLDQEFEIIKLSSGIERLKSEVSDKLNELEKLRQERDDFLVGKDQQTLTCELAIYDDLLRPSPCLDKELFHGKPKENNDEIALIFHLQDQLKGQGLRFSERVIKAFHTSLKCNSINPLTVIAGISGTGKTLLPVAYAELMGMHSLVVAVQPRWDSPQDMFGFYNYLEKTYKATDLARALVGMDQYNFLDQSKEKCTDRILLVLLDEMNLARTEYYFSEFLSKLELRRLVYDPSNCDNRRNAEIKLDTGPGSGDRFSNLWVGDNVLFVGTMNEDETTQTLSDKVLDRSNVLRFGRPKEIIRISEENHRFFIGDGYLPITTWRSWCRNSGAFFSWTDKANAWLKSLNDALEPIRRSFGYRVQESIRTYMANYPGVSEPDVFKTAFADQLEQKIIPKLRGIDLYENSSNFALEGISSILEQVGDDELSKTFEKARSDKSTGMFIWPGVSR